MKTSTLTDTLALGALTGMRSMAGPLTLALRHEGLLKRALMAMAAGEMIADKTPYVGNRIDALPLGGRAAMGAVVGGLLAREAGENVLMGAAIGAAAAVAAAHVAYRLRKALPVSGVVGGILEDAMVMGAINRAR